jgi:hypothetical protein
MPKKVPVGVVAIVAATGALLSPATMGVGDRSFRCGTQPRGSMPWPAAATIAFSAPGAPRAGGVPHPPSRCSGAA